jgi:hypothetical protein
MMTPPPIAATCPNDAVPWAPSLINETPIPMPTAGRAREKKQAATEFESGKRTLDEALKMASAPLHEAILPYSSRESVIADSMRHLRHLRLPIGGRSGRAAPRHEPASSRVS